MSKIRAAIKGVGGYVPPDVLSNADLEKMVDTNDEWIRSRTGIKERRILKGEGKGTSIMGIEAVKELLEKTGTDAMDVDLLQREENSERRRKGNLDNGHRGCERIIGEDRN